MRNYAANHPHTRELCAEILCARSMNAEELALLKMLFPDGKGLNSYDDEGMTPLMSCIRSAGKNRNDCNLDAMKFLVEAGADVNKRKNHDNRFTPLIYAAMSKCSYAGKMLEYLVEHGANINATFDAKGTRAIDILRQRINEKMKASMESSVISTVSNEVDMSAVLTLEKTFGEAFTKKYNIRLGFTPFFILGSIEALKQFRVFNAHIHENEIVYKNTYDISIITCGNDGVIAPVIRHADSMSIEEIERSMINLSRRAIEGTLSVEEVSGGTFTVVNAGVYGSLIGTDLLTPPQVATLSVHRMHDRPVATPNNGMEVRPMLYVSLSYDHRVADTKLASEFLDVVKRYVENPGCSLLGL